MDEELRPLAGNLRRLRAAAGITLVELARRSGTARATLTQLEAGGGNPTLETLYAVANQLGVPLAELIAEPVRPATRIVRRGSGTRVAGRAVEAWLLDRTVSAERSIEIYSLTLHGRVIQRSDAHPPGTREHVHLHAGQARLGPLDAPVDLGPGDYADYPADVAHSYQRRGNAAVSATLVITGPVHG